MKASSWQINFLNQAFWKQGVRHLITSHKHLGEMHKFAFCPVKKDYFTPALQIIDLWTWNRVNFRTTCIQVFMDMSGFLLSLWGYQQNFVFCTVLHWCSLLKTGGVRSFNYWLQNTELTENLQRTKWKEIIVLNENLFERTTLRSAHLWIFDIKHLRQELPRQD